MHSVSATSQSGWSGKRLLRGLHPVRWREVLPKSGPAKTISFMRGWEFSKVSCQGQLERTRAKGEEEVLWKSSAVSNGCKNGYGLHLRDTLLDNCPVISWTREVYLKRMPTKETNHNLTSQAKSFFSSFYFYCTRSSGISVSKHCGFHLIAMQETMAQILRTDLGVDRLGHVRFWILKAASSAP